MGYHTAKSVWKLSGNFWAGITLDSEQKEQASTWKTKAGRSPRVRGQPETLSEFKTILKYEPCLKTHTPIMDGKPKPDTRNPSDKLKPH